MNATTNTLNRGFDVRAATATDGALPVATFSHPRPPGRVATMRILVVEDDPTMAFMLRRTFEQQGYAVDEVSTGRNALSCALKIDYDLILLDAMIPPPDGFSVLRELRAAGRWAPVLMLTSRDGIEDLVEGLDAGADEYMTKPFSLQELLARAAALSRRALRQPLTMHPVEDGEQVTQRPPS